MSIFRLFSGDDDEEKLTRCSFFLNLCSGVIHKPWKNPTNTKGGHFDLPRFFHIFS